MALEAPLRGAQKKMRNEAIGRGERRRCAPQPLPVTRLRRVPPFPVHGEGEQQPPSPARIAKRTRRQFFAPFASLAPLRDAVPRSVPDCETNPTAVLCALCLLGAFARRSSAHGPQLRNEPDGSSLRPLPPWRLCETQFRARSPIAKRTQRQFFAVLCALAPLRESISTHRPGLRNEPNGSSLRPWPPLRLCEMPFEDELTP
jgi:hypothetical protein